MQKHGPAAGADPSALLHARCLLRLWAFMNPPKKGDKQFYHDCLHCFFTLIWSILPFPLLSDCCPFYIKYSKSCQSPRVNYNHRAYIPCRDWPEQPGIRQGHG